MEDHNFACGSAWVWNVVSNIKGGTQTEGVWGQDAEENIWTEEKWSGGRMEKLPNEELCILRQELEWSSREWDVQSM
jgi:hypothetical protein